MDLNNFIQKWTDVTVDTDGVYPNQCMDLMHEYLMDVLGLSVTCLEAPAAIDLFTNYENLIGHQLFLKIGYYPSFVPLAGDLVIWGDGIGQYGHVAIFVSGNTLTFTSFDANWPIGSKPHLQTHDYNGVIGILRFINITNNSMTAEEQDVLNGYISFKNGVINNKINEFKKENSDTIYEIFAIPSMDFFSQLGDSMSNVRIIPDDWDIDPQTWASQREYLQNNLDVAQNMLTQAQNDIKQKEDIINTLSTELQNANSKITELSATQPPLLIKTKTTPRFVVLFIDLIKYLFN
jgi:hypothetical protein